MILSLYLFMQNQATLAWSVIINPRESQKSCVIQQNDAQAPPPETLIDLVWGTALCTGFYLFAFKRTPGAVWEQVG